MEVVKVCQVRLKIGDVVDIEGFCDLEIIGQVGVQVVVIQEDVYVVFFWYFENICGGFVFIYVQ